MHIGAKKVGRKHPNAHSSQDLAMFLALVCSRINVPAQSDADQRELLAPSSLLTVWHAPSKSLKDNSKCCQAKYWSLLQKKVHHFAKKIAPSSEKNVHFIRASKETESQFHPIRVTWQLQSVWLDLGIVRTFSPRCSFGMCRKKAGDVSDVSHRYLKVKLFSNLQNIASAEICEEIYLCNTRVECRHHRSENQEVTWNFYYNMIFTSFCLASSCDLGKNIASLRAAEVTALNCGLVHTHTSKKKFPLLRLRYASHRTLRRQEKGPVDINIPGTKRKRRSLQHLTDSFRLESHAQTRMHLSKNGKNANVWCFFFKTAKYIRKK